MPSPMRARILSITLTALALFLFLTGGSTFLLMSKITEQAEKIAMEEALFRVERALEWELDLLCALAIDWGKWDDTFLFVSGEQPLYEEANLFPDTYLNFQISGIVYFDSEGEIFWGQKLEDQEEELQDLEEEERADLKALYKKARLIEQETRGSLSLHEKPVLFATSPILDSLQMEEARGALLMFRYVEDLGLLRLQSITGQEVGLLPLKEGEHFQGVDIHPLDFRTYRGSSVLFDVFLEPLGLLSSTKQRPYRSLALTYTLYLCLLLILGGCFIVASTLLFLNRHVVKRLEALTKQIQAIREPHQLSTRVDVSGNDEITSLGHTFNQMLHSLEHSQRSHKESQDKLVWITENINDVIIRVDPNWQIQYVSPNCKRLLGYTPEELDNQDARRLIYQEDLAKLSFSSHAILDNIEFRAIKSDDTYAWFSASGTVEESGAAILTLRDVSTKKATETKLQFLHSHDELTGLKNRSFFELHLQAVEKEGIYPVSLILADLNGLKLVNESLGHAQGDAFLRQAAHILLEECPKTASIARWGGDEFAVLLLGSDEKNADQLCSTIRDAFLRSTEVLSIALGFSSCQEGEKSFHEMLAQAEEAMHRNKLTNLKSARSNLVSSLQSTLHERTFETEEHALRLQEYALLLGAKLGLYGNQLDELSVLALLHDIGKVAIPDHILLKPGKLDQEEWTIMKTHPEIGWRIVSASEELASVAEGVLSHHERYDGTGYPRGLQGEEIPLLARIISIVDAFDVMTHVRVYRKKALTQEEALKELATCSGSQFDPYLVRVFQNALKEEEGL